MSLLSRRRRQPSQQPQRPHRCSSPLGRREAGAARRLRAARRTGPARELPRARVARAAARHRPRRGARRRRQHHGHVARARCVRRRGLLAPQHRAHLRARGADGAARSSSACCGPAARCCSPRPTCSSVAQNDRVGAAGGPALRVRGRARSPRSTSSTATGPGSRRAASTWRIAPASRVGRSRASSARPASPTSGDAPRAAYDCGLRRGVRWPDGDAAPRSERARGRRRAQGERDDDEAGDRHDAHLAADDREHDDALLVGRQLADVGGRVVARARRGSRRPSRSAAARRGTRRRAAARRRGCAGRRPARARAPAAARPSTTCTTIAACAARSRLPEARARLDAVPAPRADAARRRGSATSSVTPATTWTVTIGAGT